MHQVSSNCRPGEGLRCRELRDRDMFRGTASAHPRALLALDGHRKQTRRQRRSRSNAGQRGPRRCQRWLVEKRILAQINLWFDRTAALQVVVPQAPKAVLVLQIVQALTVVAKPVGAHPLQPGGLTTVHWLGRQGAMRMRLEVVE